MANQLYPSYNLFLVTTIADNTTTTYTDNKADGSLGTNNHFMGSDIGQTAGILYANAYDDLSPYSYRVVPVLQEFGSSLCIGEQGCGWTTQNTNRFLTQPDNDLLIGPLTGQALQANTYVNMIGTQTGVALYGGNTILAVGSKAIHNQQTSTGNLAVFGIESMYLGTTLANDMCLGNFCGYNQTGNNIFMIDNPGSARANAAAETANALMVGTLASTAASQALTFNVGSESVTPGYLALNTTQTTLNGTTAGTIVWSQPQQGSAYKIFVAHVSGYENNTAVNQTIAYSTAFTNAPTISTNDTGLTLSTTASTLTITAPDNTSTFTGNIIISGY